MKGSYHLNFRYKKQIIWLLGFQIEFYFTSRKEIIAAILLRTILLVEDTGVVGKNY